MIRGLIAEIAGVPRATVNDISLGNGPWSEAPETEVIERTKARLIQAIDGASYELAIVAIAKLDEKIKTASFPELITIAGAMIRIGGIER